MEVMKQSQLLVVKEHQQFLDLMVEQKLEKLELMEQEEQLDGGSGGYVSGSYSGAGGGAAGTSYSGGSGGAGVGGHVYTWAAEANGGRGRIL